MRVKLAEFGTKQLNMDLQFHDDNFITELVNSVHLIPYFYFYYLHTVYVSLQMLITILRFCVL